MERNPGCEGRAWPTWPTEGAPAPHNGPAPGRPGRRWPADLSPGCSPVARAAEVSAENGHSPGRRGEGGRLGHPKGRKSWQGDTDEHFTVRDTGKQAAEAQCTCKQQTQCTPRRHRIQLRGFRDSRAAEPQHGCLRRTQTHTAASSRPAKLSQREHTEAHT